ncbi:alpha/beta hydrolase [Apibacter sp. HY039]|uniref:alpha/beta hydrolase n=1 Tax=Apibacter sp. HY039 TaxID=2501476 RepID=UPI000FEB882E|nr:alpha/beta hydrolase [Apibacter sp. HY039]
MTIYLFSGLGADYRVFSQLDLSVLSDKIIHINWIHPLYKEKISDYALRIIQSQITDDSCIFIGVSFGGIMAIEVAKHKKPLKIILLSTIKTKNELPFYYRWFGNLKIQNLIPDMYFLKAHSLLFYFFGITEKKDKIIMSQILNDTDIKFTRWAIDQVIGWDNKNIPDNLVHIHGSKDKIFPARYIKVDHMITNQGHFMILSDSTSIQNILIQTIN